MYFAIGKRNYICPSKETSWDVDGSLMQRYWLDGKMIRVYNSNDIRSVYIDSEVELEPYFRDKSREKTPLAE